MGKKHHHGLKDLIFSKKCEFKQLGKIHLDNPQIVNKQTSNSMNF
jgi:hypothetical protein